MAKKKIKNAKWCEATYCFKLSWIEYLESTCLHGKIRMECSTCYTKELK